jgi:hypothetical protein
LTFLEELGINDENQRAILVKSIEERRSMLPLEPFLVRLADVQVKELVGRTPSWTCNMVDMGNFLVRGRGRRGIEGGAERGVGGCRRDEGGR